MKRLALIILMISLFLGGLFAADDVTGLWQSIDDETGNPSSICIIYSYEGKLYGRILLIYDENNPGEIIDTYLAPEERADLLVGDPFYSGLDFIWGLEDRGRRWGRGKILDPGKGKVYNSEIWLEEENLIVRGKIGPLGRNQVWVPVLESLLPYGFIIPDSNSLVPRIPQVE